MDLGRVQSRTTQNTLNTNFSRIRNPSLTHPASASASCLSRFPNPRSQIAIERLSMDSSSDSDSNSSKTSINPEELSAFDTSSDSLTDPAEDNSNASSEEYTDSDDDFDPSLASGGCVLIDLEEERADVVQKVYEGIDAAIGDYNKRHGTTYKFVEVEEVYRTVCHGYCFSLHFAAKPTDSHDNLLTKFYAGVYFVPPAHPHDVEVVECEAKSSELATKAD